MVDKNKVYGFLNKFLSFAQAHYKDLNANDDINKYLDHPDRVKAYNLFDKLKDTYTVNGKTYNNWENFEFNKLNPEEKELASKLLNKYFSSKDYSVSGMQHLGPAYTSVMSKDLKQSGNLHYGGIVYDRTTRKALNGSGAKLPSMDEVLDSDEDDARSYIFSKGYEIETDDNGNVNLVNPEKRAAEYRKQTQYRDLMARQEEELTKQYTTPNGQTDWIKVTIYIVIAIIILYIVYRILKWLYKWYKKRRSAKQLQKESACYDFFNYRLCEAEERHQVGKLYNSMIRPIIDFFKNIFAGTLSVLYYITNTITKASKTVYQRFTNKFKQNSSIASLKTEYTSVLNKINNLSSSQLLNTKLGNIQTVLPKI